MAAIHIPHFEWIFGLDYGDLPFESELNIMPVSKDILEYLEKRTLIFFPTTEVLERAHDMLKYNDSPSHKPGERKRFDDFGEGPWEYIVLPRCWNQKTKKSLSLPPLYNRSFDGDLHLLSFDDFDDYDALPQFTSLVHPLIVILSFRIRCPDNHPTLKNIQEKLIIPVENICRSWPNWEHNRFVPLPNTKFKCSTDNLKAQKIVCRCIMYCSRQKPTTGGGSGTSAPSTPESQRTCIEDSEEAEEDWEAHKELCRTASERISTSTWRGSET
ncbi:hypothetical protein L218DRAFT_1077659 [Marasmius fiardii PR-910]|nr:hypothetical protein L218DRAFT_1077659 [Marasmius fiardii PR-910]